MAKIYDYKGEQTNFTVMEDPRIASDGFYLLGWKHDKTTLSPVYNAAVGTNAWGGPSTTYSQCTRTTSVPTYGWGSYGLSLGKEVVCHWDNTLTNNGRTYSYQPDKRAKLSMDPNRPHQSGYFSFNNGTEDAVWYTSVTAYSDNGTVSLHSFSDVGPGEPLSSQRNPGLANGTADYAGASHGYFMWKDNRMFGFALNVNTNYTYHAYVITANTSSWPSATVSYYNFAHIGAPMHLQFIGASEVDGNPIYCAKKWYGTNCGGLYIYKYGLGTSNTSSLLANLSFNSLAVGSPSGTNNGGYAFGGSSSNGREEYNSSVFTDPRDLTGNTKCWFYPYWDDQANFHPLVYTWDTTNDTIAREDDITIIGDLSSVHADHSRLATSETDSWIHNSTTTYYQGNSIHCETWVNNGTRYVMGCLLDPLGHSHNYEGLRTWVVYDMSSSPENPKELTYHSHVTFPKPIYNYVWLNDEHSLLGLFSESAFYIYAFNAATGWNQANLISQNIWSIGRDRNDRIWYVVSDSQTNVSYPSLNLLTPTLPISITIEPELESYTYSGVTINTYVNVSAYNATGSRIATDVRLLIEGSGMEFVGGATVSTVTTSAVGELQVNIDITSAGYANITASVDV